MKNSTLSVKEKYRLASFKSPFHMGALIQVKKPDPMQMESGSNIGCVHMTTCRGGRSVEFLLLACLS